MLQFPRDRREGLAMSIFTPELLDDPVFKASELRARGHSWESAAFNLHMDEIELRRLVFADFPKWKRLEREAIRNFFQETNLEAINHTRKHIPNEDPKISLMA